jgi:hypothetical protein
MKQFRILLCLLLSITGMQTASVARAQASPERLELSGPDGKHITISAGELQSMPRQTIQVHNAHTGATETYQGAQLSLLLARLDAPLGQKLRGTAVTKYVVAEGADKSRAVYSLAEIDPAFHNGMVIVADRENGQPITRDGPFKLVNTEDKRPGRWVRNLASNSTELNSLASPTRRYLPARM